MIALQRNNGQFIYFDAITSFNRTYSASVSKFPISSGGNISDHITRENPQFTFSAVASNGGWSNSINTYESIGDFFSGNDIRFFNGRPYVSPVRVLLDTSRFTKYLPDSITQFFSSATPDVIVDDRSEGDYVKQMEDTLKNLVMDEEIVSIYEFDSRGMLRGEVTDVVITSVEFSEDADSGDALDIRVSCEKIFKTTSQTTSIPKGAVQNDVKDKTSSTSNKGQAGDTSPLEGTAQSDPAGVTKSAAFELMNPEQKARAMTTPSVPSGFAY